MAEVIKVYRETLPALRLIGKRYTDEDRSPEGGFGGKWGEWFQKGYFDSLQNMKSLPEAEGAYLGFMRCNGEFEYWIGMFFPEDTPVPEGYQYLDIPQGDVGTCWIHGYEDTGELYGQEAHNVCISKIEEKGWHVSENPWFLERYNCPRFTAPDEQGKVILDYCILLKDE